MSLFTAVVRITVAAVTLAAFSATAYAAHESLQHTIKLKQVAKLEAKINALSKDVTYDALQMATIRRATDLVPLLEMTNKELDVLINELNIIHTLITV